VRDEHEKLPPSNAMARAGGTSGCVISPIAIPCGKCCERIAVSVKLPKTNGSPGTITRSCSSGRPAPRPMFAVDSDPTSSAPVRRATSGESIAWS
jgi:hypothetical protein